LGVPAILTNHNKQTYANQALFFEPAIIVAHKYEKKLPFLSQVLDFEVLNFWMFFISLDSVNSVPK
jgi:hypothetical protein